MHAYRIPIKSGRVGVRAGPCQRAHGSIAVGGMNGNTRGHLPEATLRTCSSGNATRRADTEARHTRSEPPRLLSGAVAGRRSIPNNQEKGEEDEV